MQITREQIVESLKKGLESNPSIYAFWLEGSGARGDMDEHSDLDLWFDVEDEKVDAVMDQIQGILSKLGKLDFNYQKEKSHQQIVNKFFHIEETSETLFLDVNIQSHSRESVFYKNWMGHETKVIFDKAGVIRYRELDKEEYLKIQFRPVVEFKKRFEQYARVIGPAKRGEFIDAFRYYNKYILEPLTELARIKYAPNSEFVKNISKIMPKDIFDDLEDLYKINSAQDILDKIGSAKTLFEKLK